MNSADIETGVDYDSRLVWVKVDALCPGVQLMLSRQSALNAAAGLLEALARLEEQQLAEETP